MIDLASWLTELRLGHYLKVLTDNAIDGDVLRDLTESDLEKLGVLLGDRKRLLKAIAALEAQPISDLSVNPTRTATTRHREAERRQLTVMFVDLVGSTTLSAQLDPEDMRELITAYQITCSEIVQRFDGHIAKFMGDGVLAYFGYPRAHEDDAERAVQGGLALVQAVNGLAAPDGTALAVRVGIDTGLVVVGDLIGEGAAQEESVVGETPNRAARLQELAEPNTVVISVNTKRLLGTICIYTDLGAQQLKGFSQPTPVWCVTGMSLAESRFDARAGVGLAPFVGRAEEISLLMQRWQQSKEGEGQVVLLCGEPGVGKSRIIGGLRESIIAEPHVRMLLQCSPFYSNTAMYPVIAHLEHAMHLDEAASFEEKLERLEALLAQATDSPQAIAPLFAALLAIPTGDRYPPLKLSPQQQKERTIDALGLQVAGLACARPVLIVVEDVHWADPTTLELLDHLVATIANQRVLLVITFRLEFAPHWGGFAHVMIHTLTRLGRRDCGVLIDQITAGKTLPSELREQIIKRTDGVPLFVEELTKAVLESNLVENHGDRYMLAHIESMMEIPATLHDSLMARLDRISSSKEVAQTAACIGREFDYRVLAGISLAAEADLLEALLALSKAGLIFARGSPPEAHYIFKHALIRDAAYESLLKAQRRGIHARLADWLENYALDIVANAPEMLAQHFSISRQPYRAVEWWTKAGTRALKHSANAEAINHFHAALKDLSELSGTDCDRTELTVQIGLGSALTAVRGYSDPATVAAYQRGRELAVQLGDESHLVSVLYGLWNFDNNAGRLDNAIVKAQEMVEVASRRGETGPLVAALSALGTTLTFQGRWVEARQILCRSLALYDVREHAWLKFDYTEDPAVQAHINMAVCLWNLGEIKQAEHEMSSGIQLARTIAHANSLAYALMWRSLLDYFMADPDRAWISTQEALTLVQREHLQLWESLTQIIRSWSAMHRDTQINLTKDINDGIFRFQSMGGGVLVPCFLGVYADTLILAGRLGAAADALTKGLDLVVANNEHNWEVELLRLKGVLQRHLDPDAWRKSEHAFLAALEVSRRQGSRTMQLRVSVDLARLWLEQRQADAAASILDDLSDLINHAQATPKLMEARSLLARCRQANGK